MTRLWLDEGPYRHPVNARLGCLEIGLLLTAVVVGWILALWLDSVVQESKALRPRPTVEAQR